MTRREPYDEDPAVAELAALTEALEAMSDSTCNFLVNRVGRRGASLLFFALLDFVYAFSLLAPTGEVARSSTFTFLEHIAPLWFFGIMWAAAGVFCAVNAFRRVDWSGFVAAISIKVIWGLLYVGAAFAGLPRAYVGAAIWLCLAGWVAIISSWPEPTRLPEPLRDLDQVNADLNRLKADFGRRLDSDSPSNDSAGGD